MADATRGSSAQFTYDFGISIAQSTVRRITALTGATLSLASAFYALKTTASEYVDSLRKNTFLFGGVLGTLKQIEQAQNRLIKGQSYFAVDDQLSGMNRLMAAGVDVQENLSFISKAAHAAGQSFSQFSGAVASAIAGNMGQLVDMGILTQRSTRMFEKYAANTIQREKAIIEFLKTHKGLSAAIRNDFDTVQDQIRRIGAAWKSFLQAVVGKPNDSSSLYGQTTMALRAIADSVASHLEQLKKVGFMIGQVMGWVVRNVGHFVVWLGRKFSSTAKFMGMTTDRYVEFTRSLIVWLEFAKHKVLDILKTIWGWAKDAVLAIREFYTEHSTLAKVTVALGAVALAWKLLGARILACYALQMRYIAFQGPALGKWAVRIQSLAVWLPRPFRGAWVAIGKFVGQVKSGMIWYTKFGKVAQNVGKVIFAPFRMAIHPIKTVKALISGMKGVFGTVFRKITATLGKLLNWLKSGAILKALGTAKNGFIKAIMAIANVFRHPIGSVLKLFRLIKTMFTSIRLGIAALYASNPFGWILLAVTALVTLYTQCKSFRLLVNGMFKAWWEYLKLLWNMLYGTFIAIAVCVKRYIWQPLKNAFMSAIDWIKEMWNSFKDSSVGRFIDKWIVSPLSTLFSWIMKGIRWILKGAATILSVINNKLADKIREGEKELGMDNVSLAARGSSYDFDDDTNYLNPKNWGVQDDKKSKASKDTKTVPSNPILDVSSARGIGGGGTVVNNNMEYKPGAIQIIVNHGEQIDENKLAQKVRYVIKDMNREQSIRGGAL